ncbi:hypothetical protein AURDEDRAFT_117433 [Auricularia subglabra TFB-10046 SS5]|uniref:Uncharacterized protein n=1 Tax=Auricularia subglabra (strain TFB-10046 / SS5) TaxID=717982 RepID=J0LEG6_AURST|nr:hypothetical protein AURDEDRAFT_117433 [Auricularia subglabra TFB-10046 SS5]
MDDCGVLEAPHLRVIWLLARARTPEHTDADASRRLRWLILSLITCAFRAGVSPS